MGNSKQDSDNKPTNISQIKNIAYTPQNTTSNKLWNLAKISPWNVSISDLQRPFFKFTFRSTPLYHVCGQQNNNQATGHKPTK